MIIAGSLEVSEIALGPVSEDRREGLRRLHVGTLDDRFPHVPEQVLLLAFAWGLVSFVW
jgi:hypothetical protein